jgi:alpha-L-rhamnosidase
LITPGFPLIAKRATHLPSNKCRYDSNYGKIVSNWTREGGKVSMKITIPPNTTATVFVPTQDADCMTESGKPASRNADLRFLRMEIHTAVYAASPGSYQFQSMFPGNND